MRIELRKLLSTTFVTVLAFASLPAGIVLASAAPTSPVNNVSATYSCPSTSSASYSQGLMYQYDIDNPVRPAYNHADKNLKMRSYDPVGGQTVGLVSYGGSTDSRVPQFATLFNPSRVPAFTNTYQVHDWTWADSPATGTQGAVLTDPYPVTALGLGTTPGEVLRAPSQGYDLGSPWGKGAVILYADADSITLGYTRADSVAIGYTLHVQNICTDPNLLAVYNSLEGPRDVWYNETLIPDTRLNTLDYNLAGLTPGQSFGTASGSEIVVAIVDSGAFEDPRSINDWWQIRPAAPPTPAPILISPPNKSMIGNGTTTADLSWGGVADATDYDVQVSLSSNYALPLQLDTNVPDLGLTTPSLPDGLYYWHVRANTPTATSNWSTTWNFTIDNVPTDAPLLSSPKNLSVSKTGTPKLGLKKPKGAVQYHFQLYDGSDFSTAALLFEADVNKPQAVVDPPLAFGTYYWQAQDSDAAGNVSDWSLPSSFTYTLMSSPKNGSITHDTTPSFSWKGFSGAVGYELHVTDGGSFDTTWSPTNPTSTKFTVPTETPLDYGTYHWEVRVNTLSGWTNWMPTWDVSITP